MSKIDRNYSLFRNTIVDFADTGMIFLLVALIADKQIAVASAIVVHNYMNRVSSIVNYISMLMEKVKDFNLSSERIFNIINTDNFTACMHISQRH